MPLVCGFPWCTMTIRTALSVEAVRNALSHHVLDGSPSLHPDGVLEDLPAFRGHVRESSFVIVPRSLRSVASFRPLMRGRLDRTSDGTEVSVVARMNLRGSLLFLWAVAVGGAMIGHLMSAKRIPETVIVGLVVLAFVAGIIRSYVAWSTKSERILRDALKAIPDE